MGKESVCGVKGRIAPEEWSYMDIVVSVCSPIVACIAEREEVRKCVELLNQSFSIGQQCGCVNECKKESKHNKKEDNEGEAMQEVEQGAGGMKGRQEVGRRGMSTIVRVIMKWTDCLRFTLKDGVASWVVLLQDLRLSAGIVVADWRDECCNVYCLGCCR